MLRRVAVLYRNEAKLEPYVSALKMAGLEAVPVTPGAGVSCSDFSGVLLTGGTDVDPALYNQARHARTQQPDRERDDYELEFAGEAVRADLPVLAICRGMQLLNVMCGGRLIQDLPDSGVAHTSPAPAGAEPGRHPAVHSVEFQQVNSRHHQAVEQPGVGIAITGRAGDGVIESCKMQDKRFVVGVQWHPEDRVLVSEPDRRLFEAFAAAVQQGL